MKKIVMVGPRKSEIVETPIPKIKDNELLVKVTYTGMCHSEWYPWSVAAPGEEFGHESVCIVAECGSKVTDFKVGDRVTGLGGGGYREYIVMEPEKTCHVPDNLKDEDAIVEPLACLLSAALKMKPEMLGDSIAVDLRAEARENARKMGATEVYAPEELPSYYRLDWDAIGCPDLKRDGHKTDIFGIGFPNVMEFTGTESGLQLAGELACAHGRLGIGGYHNDSLRTIDYKLWNFKAITTINCHERRIMYEAGLCKRCLMLLSRGIWKFTGMTTHVYSMEEFDKANEDMETHSDNFIKGVVKC